MEVDRKTAGLWSAGLLLLAIAAVRLAVPDRSRIRSLSIEGLDIPTEMVGQDQTIVRERAWTPPDDVYVLGWNYHIGAAGAGAELVLMAGDIRLFTIRSGDLVANPTFFTNGAAYLLRKGKAITMRYKVVNTGPPGQTNGASALVYFVAVQGN